MFQKVDLRELSQLQGPERAFLSYYGPGAGALKALDARERAVRAFLADAPDEAEHFEQNLALLRRTLEEQPTDAKGLAAFACWALDFVRGYPLAIEVPEMLRIGAAPYIRPLAELQDEYENFLVVAADNKATRIFQVTSAVPEQADKVKGDVKNAVKVGGWSQQRYARRREKQLHHYAKEIGDVLAGLVREGDFTRIVLLGSPETTREIESILPTDVAAKVVGSRSVDLHAQDKDLIDQAYDLYFDEERASEDRLWERIKGEYLGHGLAAAGADDVLKAALVGRAEAVLVNRDAKLKGTRCRDCQNIVAGEPAACPACGSESVFGLDLVNELARQMELTSGRVEFTDPIPGLSDLGGVAALLRY